MGLALPNGHYVFLAQMGKAVSNVAGYSGTTNVARDVLVDVDQNYKPDRVPMLLVDEGGKDRFSHALLHCSSQSLQLLWETSGSAAEW
jgi:hypothetical protein